MRANLAYGCELNDLVNRLARSSIEREQASRLDPGFGR